MHIVPTKMWQFWPTKNIQAFASQISACTGPPGSYSESKQKKTEKNGSVLNHPQKDWCWSWSSDILATWCKEPAHWKRPWCWERLTGGGEGDDRGRDGWMASSTQWTWVWASAGSWWRTVKPGVLQSMEVTKSQTWLNNWTELTEDISVKRPGALIGHLDFLLPNFSGVYCGL